MNTEIRFLAQHLLHAGVAPLTERDRRVIARVARRMHTARDVNRVFEARSTLGQRLADRVAAAEAPGASSSGSVSSCCAGPA